MDVVGAEEGTTVDVMLFAGTAAGRKARGVLPAPRKRVQPCPYGVKYSAAPRYHFVGAVATVRTVKRPPPPRYSHVTVTESRC